MNQEQLKCDYCGKIKDSMSFFIGASDGSDWTMHDGTGKVTCPDCHKKGVEEAEKQIKRHIEQNKKDAFSGAE